MAHFRQQTRDEQFAVNVGPVCKVEVGSSCSFVPTFFIAASNIMHAYMQLLQQETLTQARLPAAAVYKTGVPSEIESMIYLERDRASEESRAHI